MAKRVTKVVIPVAGLGTRVLPATKSIPKELLPVVDRPLIDYVVAEARDAGIEHVILVTGRGKSAIEDYFDHAFELETTLRTKAKTDILADIEKTIPRAGDLSYTRQQAPLGLGHAVWCARAIVGDEPFAVSLPDEIVPSRPGFLKQMVEAYEKVGVDAMFFAGGVTPEFLDAVRTGGRPPIDAQAGFANVRTAHRIMEQCRRDWSETTMSPGL